MIYVLLDTNIIIDMVIDRRDNVISGNLLKIFIKLLDYGEVKLILPNVIKVETYRHLDSEIKCVGKKIDSTMDSIKNLYGISTYEMDPLDLTDYKKNARAELHKAQKIFQQKEADYQRDIQKVIELLFSHKNTIVIDDADLMSSVLRRRIYKRAPFHKEMKESFGDGTITETLVNVKNYVDVKPKDKIFFVTGNYQDFSETEKDKDKLHHHIVEDLQKSGLGAQVVYIRSFNNLIYPNLSTNIENANLVEEFEAEMKEEEESFYRELDDDLRESAGLTPLGNFISQLEEGFTESQFVSDVLDLFDRINTAYGKLEDISIIYEDELEIDEIECSELVHRLSGLVGCENNPTVENLLLILDWIDERKRKCEVIDACLPDYIRPGEDVEFWDINRNRYFFSLDRLDYLTPGNGETDSIDIRIIDGKKEIVATGTIDITYGFIEEDPFDGIGDGCAEDIDYNTSQITDKLKEICEDWEAFIEENSQTVTAIKGALNM